MNLLLATKFIYRFSLNFVLIFQIIFASSLSTYAKSTTIDHLNIENYFKEVEQFKKDLRGYELCNDSSDKFEFNPFDKIVEQKKVSGVYSLDYLRQINIEENNKEIESLINVENNSYGPYSENYSIDPSFTPKQTKSEYTNLLSSINKNTCSNETTSIIDAQSLDSSNSRCVKIKGFLSDISLEISYLEPSENISEEAFNRLAKRINYFYKQGLKHKIRLKQLLRYKLSDDTKRYLIINYNQNIAVSLRDMFVMVGMISDTYYDKIDELLPLIPTELFDWSLEDSTDFEDTEESYERRVYLNLLLQGTNSNKDPISLEVVDVGDEYTQIKFDDHGMSSRDVTTVMEHISSKNYLYGLRVLTVQMMINQVKNYDLMMGNYSNEINVPNSCVNNKNNGIWSKTVNIKINQDTQSNMRQKLLKNHKLLFIEGDSQQQNYYINNSSMNLLTDSGFNSGTIEFDNYQNALAAVEEGRLNDISVLKPVHDDEDILDDYLSLKRDQALGVYYTKTRNSRKRKSSSTLEYKDINLFYDIVGTPSKGDYAHIYDRNKKRTVKVDFDFNGVSNYMKYRMISDGVSDPNELVSKRLKNKLKSNKIKISLPSLYSPASYRSWGLRTLQKGVERVVEKSDKDFFIMACRAYSNSICRVGPKPYENINEFLSSLNLNADFLPLDSLKSKKIEDNISFLNLVWNRLRDVHKALPEALLTEDQYLLAMFNSGSSFARMRLSYLLAKEELELLKNSKEGIYKNTTRGRRLTSKSKCRKRTFDSVLSRLNESMSLMGLNNPLRPGYVSSVLSKEESLILFQKVLEKVDSKFTNVLGAKVNSENTAYDLIKTFSNENFNTIQSVNNSIEKNLGFDYQLEDTEDKLDDLFNGEESKRIQFYHDLASLKTKSERQSHYEKYAASFGINSEFDLILDMLYVDSEVKKPIYDEVLYRAASIQKDKTYNLLNEFCKLDLSDNEKIKKYFYSTLTVQNKMNETLGIAKVPEKLMEKINSMTFEEKRNIGLGLGAFVIAIGASVVLAGSCPFTLGVSCGVLGGLMAGGAFSMGSSVFISEYQMKKRADIDESYVSSMESIGMTERASSEKIARSWLGTALSTLDVVPILGVVSRGVYLAGKISKESIKSLIRNSSKIGIRNSLNMSKGTMKNINNEADIKLAKLITGFSTYTSRFLSLIKSKNADDLLITLDKLDLADEISIVIKNQIEKTKDLYSRGLISKQTLRQRLDILKNKIQTESISKNGGLYKYLSTETVNLSKLDIDNQTAHTLVKYFEGDPKELLQFIKGYSKKLQGLRHKGAKSKLSYIKASRGVHERGANFIRKMWNENTYNLAKNHLKLKKLEKALLRVKNEKEFQSILANHMDEFTAIFAKAPIRLIDAPYMIAQGGFHMANTYLGKIPGVKKMGMSIIMRKIANARSLLIGESILSNAKNVLGMEKVMTAQSVSLTMKGLQAVSLELAEKSSIAEGKVIKQNLQEMRHLIVSEIEKGIYLYPVVQKLIFENGINIINKSNGKVNITELRRLLFDFDTTKEETLSDILWSTINVQKLLSKKSDNSIFNGFFKADEEFLKDEFKFLVTKAMDNLISDTTVSGIQRYAIMSKILIMSKNLGHIELY